MPNVPINPPPGVLASGTRYQSKGRWRDAHLIRFFERVIKAVGGWDTLRGTPPDPTRTYTWIS